MIKGELTSDFADRLKLEFEESEMSKATVWSLFEYKVIASLNTANSDDKDLKTKLIQEIKRNPDPDEAGLESFLKVIREHEVVINAREYKEDAGGTTLTTKRVKTQGEPPGGQQHPPHKVCGKVHGRGECQYKCKECKKPHKEDDCYILHPDKRPASWKTPPKKKEGGRGRERERSRTDRDRSKTRSGDRRGEKPKDRRQPSPYQPRERVDRVTKKDRRNESEDDSEQERQDQKELDRLLEKSEKLQERLNKKKGSAATRRVRSELFEEGRDESAFMELQREWTRGENSRDSRPSKESRDWSRSVRRVKSDKTFSPPTRGTSGICPLESSWSEGRKTYSTVREAVGSRRSTINLNEQDEEGRYVPQMVGYGDFRGYHLDNPDSSYRPMVKRIKEGQISDPTLKGKFLNQPRGKWMNFCCDTERKHAVKRA